MSGVLQRIRTLPGEGRIWAVAFRNKKEKLIFEGNAGGFSLIPNSLLYWRADPFLFDYNGRTYLFAELYNRITGKGVIGVSEIKNGKCTRFKVCIEESYHLSYPCVFIKNGEIYMVPESGHSGGVVLYKSVIFPDKWERVLTMEGCPAVDTTPIPTKLLEGEAFVATINTQDGKNDNLFLIDLAKKQRILLKSNDSSLRSAGHFIEREGKYIRPSQDCETDYGTDLIFKQIDAFGERSFREHEIQRIYPFDVRFESKKAHHMGNKMQKFDGIHTYNISERYEVIDLSYNVGISFPYLLHKVYKHFKRL